MESNQNIMNTNSYMAQNLAVSKTTRFLWWCAGADEYFLLQSPKQDRVKYAGIGGIVLATGLLAAVSGGFAFYTIFKTKGDANDDAGMSWLLAIGVLLFMAIWGSIIFNLDRFIISSTGKGDGTDKISGPEFAQAIPRILIALVLGFAISAPLEIKILESEINSKLKIDQDEYTEKLNNITDVLFKQKQASLEKNKNEFETKLYSYELKLKEYDVEIDKLTAIRQLEISGKNTRGVGKIAGEMQIDINNKKNEKENYIKSKAFDVSNWRNQLKYNNDKIIKLEENKANEYEENKKKSYGLDGLLKRIQISHEIGGMIPWVIFAVFLCIEMGPIFFKMMMTKGAYDYMVENFNHKIQTENGVFKEDKLYEGKNGLIHMEKYRYADVELAKHEREEKLKEQKRITSEIVTKWGDKKMGEIKENPDAFLNLEK